MAGEMTEKQQEIHDSIINRANELEDKRKKLLEDYLISKDPTEIFKFLLGLEK